MLWGCLLAFVTPGRSGEFFRGISITSGNKATMIYAVFIEKIYAILITLIAGALGAAFSWRTLRALQPAQKSILMCCGTVIAGITLVFGIHFFSGNKHVHVLKQLLPKNIPAFPFANFTKKTIPPTILLSVAAHLVLLFQTAVLLDMFGNHAWAINMVIAAQAYSFMLFFPIFIANMGIREYSLSLFLGQFATSSGQPVQISGIAFGASMGILCINMILPALAGLLWWVGKKRIKVKG
jgi:hypothetical protein